MMKAILALASLVLAFAQDADTQASFVAVDANAPAPPPPSRGVSKEANKKITMVVSTLKDILQSVVNEEKQETEMYNKYVGWCVSEGSTQAKDLSEAQTELANAKVLAQEVSSNVESLTLTIKRNGVETEETKDSIAQAVSLRTDENEKYTEEVQLNTQSLRQIELAIQHVNKVQGQGGFLQNGVLKKLAVNQPGESSYVLGVMKGLKEKLTKNRNQMLAVEKEKVTMHNSFMGTKGQSLRSLSETTTGKQIELTESTAKGTSTNQKIRKLTEEIAAIQASSSKMSEGCDSTKQEWKVRQDDRTKEKAALNEAIRFLAVSSIETMNTGFFGLEQTDANDASVVFSPAFLQTISETASKYSDNAFFAQASAELSGENDEIENHLRKGTFDGVSGVVQKLITSHQDTQSEETDKKKYCDKELAAKEDERDTTTTDLAATKASVEKKTSEAEQLAEEVKNLYKAIDNIKKSLDDATKLRKEQATIFQAGSKDRALALKVLMQAKTVLQAFYNDGKTALVEAPPPQKPGGPGSGRKTTASFGAVSMVQDIADDITKEEKDAVKEEQDAAGAYADLQKESRKNTDEKHADITQRVMAKAKLGVQINTLKETQTQQSDDLTAIKKQLVALHESCDELLKFYDKRVKARTFEVSQLRDVMDILAGSSIAPRTGLMQDDEQDNGADSQA